MMPEPPELKGLSTEELRFYRLIEEREMADDGSQEITMACGHKTVQIIPLPETVNYAYCVQCLSAWIEAESKKKEEK